MSHDNDNFDALWAQFKEQVRERRERRKDPDDDTTVRTFQAVPMGHQYGGTVAVGLIDDDLDTGTFANMHVSGRSWFGRLSLTKGDMVNLAAELMAVAHECEELEQNATTEQQ